jgi:hypothetical protein
MSEVRKRAVKTRTPVELLRDIDAETLEFQGRRISRLEAMMRIVYARALKGDVRASEELQRARDRGQVDTPPKKVGCLVVPEPMSLDEWERLAAEQQAPFREKRSDDDFN